MVEPIATAQDVRGRLNLPDAGEFEGSPGISDEDIELYLEDAAADNVRENDLGRMDETTQKQIEWRLAGIKILGQRKGLRAYHQQSLGSMSRSYEVKSIDELRSELDDWDPSGNLASTKPKADISVPGVK